jgi:methylmalonyl-CoA mutase
MADALDDLSLASDFPAASRGQWLALVKDVLKGESFDAKLVAKTYDGLAIEPLYDRARASAIVARAPGAPWQVTQRIDHPDHAAANAEALHDAENGATGFVVIAAGAVGGYGFGLDPTAGIDRVLDRIPFDQAIAIELDWGELDLGPGGEAVVEAVAAQARVRGNGVAEIRFGLDPLGAALATGQSPQPWNAIGPRVAKRVTALARQGFGGPFVVADGRIIHNAGGSEAQELGYVLATAVTYLRALEAEGVALDDARGMIFFRLAADADQILTIAKFRALRLLWARIEQATRLAPRAIFISAETAWRMMSRRDPWVNMLRATMAVFAAGIGGANSITVLPHTMALGLPDRFARRIARNTQLVLLEESNLAKVADAAAGSGGVEDMTRKLCAAAWTLFQEIERAGYATTLADGLLQEKVTATRAERQRAVALRKDALTGTSEFPDIGEASVSVLDIARVTALPHGNAAVSITPLPAMRLAEPFERLRDRSDAILARSGSRPKVFLAGLGRIGDYGARVMFAKNFFEAGGIEALAPDGSASVDDMAARFKQSGASLVCLCSSDDVYGADGARAAKMLAAAGARRVYLGGRPKKSERDLLAAGVHTFIYVGCDVVETLESALRILEGA